MTAKKTIQTILWLWDNLEIPEFESRLCDLGWYLAAPVSWKTVFIKVGENVVIKFCRAAQNDHTYQEHCQWSRARPHKRRYMAREIAYSKGLLIQERLPRICGYRYCECDDAKEIAHRLRILDWHNHGWDKKGRLKFFDTDSMGTGWYNWKEDSNDVSPL